MIDWIGNMTDDISRQVEQTEAEAEALQTTKKKKAAADRLGELDQLNERRQWHVGRLEVVQRMLENGQLSTEQVEAIQEDVKYFVEANTVSRAMAKDSGYRWLMSARRRTLTLTKGSMTNSTCKTRTR
jgi:CCR4-NOT transcriptional regulation complex NOT5 subunit